MVVGNSLNNLSNSYFVKDYKKNCDIGPKMQIRQSYTENHLPVNKIPASAFQAQFIKPKQISSITFTDNSSSRRTSKAILDSLELNYEQKSLIDEYKDNSNFEKIILNTPANKVKDFLNTSLKAKQNFLDQFITYFKKDDGSLNPIYATFEIERNNAISLWFKILDKNPEDYKPYEQIELVDNATKREKDHIFNETVKYWKNSVLTRKMNDMFQVKIDLLENNLDSDKLKKHLYTISNLQLCHNNFSYFAEDINNIKDNKVFKAAIKGINNYSDNIPKDLKISLNTLDNPDPEKIKIINRVIFKHKISNIIDQLSSPDDSSSNERDDSWRDPYATGNIP